MPRNESRAVVLVMAPQGELFCVQDTHVAPASSLCQDIQQRGLGRIK